MVTLTGTLANQVSGTPHQGVAHVEPTVPVVIDTGTNKVLLEGTTVTLDANGSFTIDIPASDDPALSPQGFTYRIGFKLTTGKLADIIFLAPAATPALDLSGITPVEDSVGVPYISGPQGLQGTQGLQGLQGDPGTDAVAPSFSATPTWRAPWAQNNGSTGTQVIGQLLLIPILIPTQLTLSGLAISIRSAGTASASYVCLYTDDGSFLPADLVVATSALDNTSTGVKAETFTDVPLEAGVYWIGTLSTGTTGPALEAATQANNSTRMDEWLVMPHGTGSSPSINAGNDGQVALQNGHATPPATFAGSTATDKNSPKVAMWVAMKVNR